MPIHANLFRRAILTSKVSQSDPVLVCYEGSLLRLHMQDFKWLSALAMLGATLVDQKLDFHILTVQPSKVGQTRGECVGAHVTYTCSANFVTIGQ